MFSSTRLHLFVCVALGIAVSAAPAGSGANVDARSPDVYDLSGGLIGLLLGAEAQGGDSDEDTYILKRQLAGLDIGSRLGMNMGLQHAAVLGEAGLGLTTSASIDGTATKRDVYDLSGGLLGLLLGAEAQSGNSDEDTYILKRQLAGLDIGSRLGSNVGLQHAAVLGETGFGLANSVGSDGTITQRDVYDLSGGLLGLLFGAEAQGGDSDEDTYILKRQLAGLDIGSRLGNNMGIQHAATLGEGLGLDSAIAERDLYDLSGGIGALLFGGENAGSGEDEYILKRDTAGVEARSPDIYDLSGGLLGLFLGAEAQGGDNDEDIYILKRQLAGLDIGSRLGNNMGIQHAATLGEGLGLDSAIAERDLYDLNGGIGALLFGGENRGSDEDEYILKRQLEAPRN